MHAPEDEPAVLIRIGHASEVMQPERREATEQWVEQLREQFRDEGISIRLDVQERIPGRYGLTLIEWTGIFVGNGVASTLVAKITEDLYESAKDLLRRRRKHAIETGVGRKRLGFTLYGPDGEVLRRWTTDEDGEDKQDEDAS